MKKIILLWLCLGLYCYVHAQVITIKDQETGQPLELATLASEAPRASATTNARGQADISVFKGAEEIHISYMGYKTAVKSYAELQQNQSVVLIPSNLSIDQIVVSASRWNQHQRDIPGKVTTVSTKKVALLNPQTAADLLGTSEEVFIQKSQLGGGSPMIRGFSTNRLLYTVDGVRMNTAIFRGGNIQNIISLDPFAIENTEVFFGPGSVIYGSDAIGGVMSFQTLTPQLSLDDKTFFTGKAVARYSSAANEKTGHFDVGAGWQKWALLSGFSYSDFGDLRMGKHGPDEYLRPFYVMRIDSTDVIVKNDDPQVQVPTGYSQINLMQKLRFKPNEKWDVQYGFHYSTTSGYARYDRHIRLRNGAPRSAEWYYGPQVWMMNNLNVSHSGDNKVYDQMTIRLAHQRFEESRHDRDFNDPVLRHRVEEVNAWSANLDFNKTIRTKHHLYYGLEFVYNDVTSTGTDENIVTDTIMPGPSRYPQSSWASYGAYVTYQYDISRKMLLKAGVRYNHFMLDAAFDTSFYPFPFTTANISNGAVMGSLGFMFNPNDNWSLNVNASTGFRAPNVDDVGKVFDSEPGAVVVPNPDLQAEYAYNVEAGIAKVFGDWVKIDATGYYTILMDAMVRRDFMLNGMDSIVYEGELSRVQAIQNAAKATVFGVQAGIEVKLPLGFGISSRINYQKGEEELDDGTTSPSRHAPPVFGGTHLTYSKHKLNLDLYVLYNGEKSFEELPEEERGKDYIYAIDENGNPYSPAWYTLNFKAMYRINDHFSVSAGVENLTDKRYRPYSSGIVAPGRNFILSVKGMF